MKDEHVNDISNYQKLYMQYAPMLLRFAGKFISPFFAEDIVHDVFLRIWDKQVFLLSESEVKNILFVAVRNACIDHCVVLVWNRSLPTSVLFSSN